MMNVRVETKSLISSKKSLCQKQLTRVPLFIITKNHQATAKTIRSILQGPCILEPSPGLKKMAYYKKQRVMKQLPKLSTLTSRRTILISYMTVRLTVATSLFQKKLMKKHHPINFIPQILNCRLVYLRPSSKLSNHKNRCKMPY